MEWAAKQGIKLAYLLTTDALSYWERYGFEVISGATPRPAFKAQHNGRADARPRLSRCVRFCEVL